MYVFIYVWYVLNLAELSKSDTEKFETTNSSGCEKRVIFTNCEALVHKSQRCLR